MLLVREKSCLLFFLFNRVVGRDKERDELPVIAFL